jgi:fatty-acyl-CoA synthase/long-chain acyl-CoA synthetase
MNAPLETNAAALRRVASERADHPAIIADGTAISYAALVQDLDRVSARARDWDIAPGTTVAVEWTTLPDHWLLLLALEERGAATASFLSTEIAKNTELVEVADVVIGRRGPAAGIARRFIETGAAWWSVTRASRPAEPPEPVVPTSDQPARLVQSSGTTGQRKRMLRALGSELFRIRMHAACLGLDAGSRYLVTMSFAMQGIYLGACAALRAGATIVWRPETAGTIRAFAGDDITHATMLPIKLEAVLAGMPSGRPSSSAPRILLQGGAASPDFRQRVSEGLGAELVETYATNEVGMIGIMEADGTGHLLPGVDMRIVGDDGTAVNDGPGLVQVRSPGMVGGFHEDEERTGALFREGWFQPGDIAEMIGDGRFRLLGRADDLLNYRGVKFTPQRFEEALASACAVTEFCVTVIPGHDPGFWVVFVPSEAEEDPAEIGRLAARLLPNPIGRAGVLAVRDLPRTETGKLRRREISERLIRTLQSMG